MTAFLRFSQRKDLQYYAPDHHRPVRRRRQRLHSRRRSERFRRLHLDRHAHLSLPGPPGFLPYAGRQGAAVFGRPEHGFHVRRRFSRPADHTRSHRRPQHADHHRIHYSSWAAKPAIRSSRILLPGIRNSIIRRPWAGIPSKWVTNSCPSAPRFWTPTRFMVKTRTTGASASPPARNWASLPAARSRATPPATASRISCSALPTNSTWGATRSSICGNSCTRCIFRTTIG